MSGIVGQDCWKCLFFHQCEAIKAYDECIDCIIYNYDDNYYNCCKAKLLAALNISIPPEILKDFNLLKTKLVCKRFQPVPHYYCAPVLDCGKWRELGLLRDYP